MDSCQDDPRDPGLLERHVADLRHVLEVSRQLAATTELEPLLRTVEQAALNVLDCERATVFLFDRDRHELYSRMATGITTEPPAPSRGHTTEPSAPSRGATIHEIRFNADLGVAGEVVRTGTVINVPDAYADARFNPDIDRQTGFHTRNILAFPLVGFDNTTVGVLQVLNKAEGSFDPWDEELVTTFGAQVGVAVQRQILLEQYAEKQKIENDLNIARQIQQGLLPDGPPQVAGFDIAGWNEPADATGGDCYDFVTLDDGSVAITIADATGHGIGPALVIAECRALFHATISMTGDLGAAVAHVNRLLCADLPSDRFVTAFFGVASPADGSVTFTSAGQGPLLEYDYRKGSLTERRADGPPLGIMADMDYGPPTRLAMSPGDMLILVTDGFFEWTNAAGEQYGTERLAEVVHANRDRPSAEIIERVYEAVLSFAGGTPQADDLTAVIVKKL